jgi:hypothetical protein
VVNHGISATTSTISSYSSSVQCSLVQCSVHLQLGAYVAPVQCGGHVLCNLGFSAVGVARMGCATALTVRAQGLTALRMPSVGLLWALATDIVPCWKVRSVVIPLRLLADLSTVSVCAGRRWVAVLLGASRCRQVQDLLQVVVSGGVFWDHCLAHQHTPAQRTALHSTSQHARHGRSDPP